MLETARGRLRVLPVIPRAFLACLKFRVLLALGRLPDLIQTVPPVQHRTTQRTTSEISRAVYFSARLLPRTYCLAQALAVRELMHRYGRPCELQVGVATAGGFRAHAWVTAQGAIVHGWSPDHFVPVELSHALK